MNQKFFVIIDDEPQDEVLEDLIHQAGQEKIHLECRQLNPNQPKYRKEIIGEGGTPDFVIDLERVIGDLDSSDYLNRKVDLLACDFNLEDEVNGFEIIKVLKERRKFRKPIVLYSANIDEVIAGFVNDETTRITQIRSLVQAGISDFCDKDYSESVLRILKKSIFALESEVEYVLDEYSEWTFASVFPEFSGKTFREILTEIQRGTAQGAIFQRVILQNAMAHLIELNKDVNE